MGKNPQTHIIATDADLRQGLRGLRRKCRVLRGVHDAVGDPPLRRLEGGFGGLARIVVSQQLSAASAAAIWRKTEAAVRPFTPKALLKLDDPALRGAGLSRPKIATLRALAAAIAHDGLRLDTLDAASDGEIRDSLTSIRGIGPWTCDVYLMFCLGRADAWAPGDLALQLAAQSALDLKTKPLPADLEDISQRWRPWRGVAARLLWHYYAAEKAAQKARRSSPARA